MVNKVVHKPAIFYLVVEIMQLLKSTENVVVLHESKGTWSTQYLTNCNM